MVNSQTAEIYLNKQLDKSQIEQVRYLLLNKFQEYIENYSGKPLSEEWIKQKGQNLFWRGKGYNSNHGAFVQVFDRHFEFVQQKNGYYNIGYFQVEGLPQYFMIACDKFQGRKFLPDGEDSFDSQGESTDAFCQFLTSLSVEAATEAGV